MSSEIPSERRHVQRFLLKAFAVVQTMLPAREKVFELSTQDISSAGAFFPMKVPLPTGEKVRVTLYLSISAIRDFPAKARIMTDGKVVRSTNRGMAVAFGSRYTMSSAWMGA